MYSIIIYSVLNDNLDVSNISTHTHLLVLVICSITRLYGLQPKVLGIIFLIPSQGRSFAPKVAVLEAIKEIPCMYYLLRGIGVEVKLTFVVRCDNVGAITFHIDTKYHFVRKHIEDGFIKIVFVISE